MSAREQCEWLRDTMFHVYEYDPFRRWRAVPGLYVFARLDQFGDEWTPLYVGRAKSLRTRLSNHEDWPEAEREGATHVHVRVVHDANERKKLEKKLIRTYQPLLNEQHR